MKVNIRKAGKKDFKEIAKLILELAEFEKLTPPDPKALKRMKKEAFSDHPRFNILVAEVTNDIKEKEIAGYAFYFFTYSTFMARPSLYLEDIYVSEKYRNKGIGKEFFNELNKTAKKAKCGRMEWAVLDWNLNAIKFYNNSGAKELTGWKSTDNHSNLALTDITFIK